MSGETAKRPYRKQKRAELEEETRLRITESAVALHEELGPARTTISAIAEHAGVRRSTVYRHFPDEAAIFAACSGLWSSRNPEPDPGPWTAIADPAERLATALSELYAYYRRTERMIAGLIRDEAVDPLVAQGFGEFWGYLEAIAQILAAGRPGDPPTRAALGHAVDFRTWQSLIRQGLSDDEAVALMCRFVDAAAP